jgi:hypothetical protein
VQYDEYEYYGYFHVKLARAAVFLEKNRSAQPPGGWQETNSTAASVGWESWVSVVRNIVLNAGAKLPQSPNFSVVFSKGLPAAA